MIKGYILLIKANIIILKIHILMIKAHLLTVTGNILITKSYPEAISDLYDLLWKMIIRPPRPPGRVSGEDRPFTQGGTACLTPLV